MTTQAETITLNLRIPTDIKMKVESVNSHHMDGNLVLLKNELYEISFKDKTKTWKSGDNVKITIPKQVKTTLRLPIEIRSQVIED